VLLLLAFLLAWIGIRRLQAPVSRDEGLPPAVPALAPAADTLPAPPSADEDRIVAAVRVDRADPEPVVPEKITPVPAKVPTPSAPREERRRRQVASNLTPAWIADMEVRLAADPASALEFCRSLPPDQQMMAFSTLFERWVRKDPESALAWLAATGDLPVEAKRRIAPYALFELGRRDPVAALNILAGSDLPDATTRNRLTADILGGWIAMDSPTALVWIRDSDVDEDTYDRAILAALQQMTGPQAANAAALFAEFVGAGRMDAMTDPTLYAQTVSAAKLLGATLGGLDYFSALEWGFGLPPDSAAQAYILSNVAFSQSHGPTLPDMPWIGKMDSGFVRTRVLAALAYGRLLANGDTTLSPEVKRQLDADDFNLPRIKAIVQQSNLPAAEKRTLLPLL
jgi:hypothetical protein